MSAVAVLPTQLTLNEAWSRYQELVLRAIDRPALFADRKHMEAMHRADRAFADLLISTERAL